MKAVQLVRSRIAFTETAFAEMVLWKLPKPVPGSAHLFNYRLAYLVEGICVLRYDNETGKGDHRHFMGHERDYGFVGPDKLLEHFLKDIARWNLENRHP